MLGHGILNTIWMLRVKQNRSAVRGSHRQSRSTRHYHFFLPGSWLYTCCLGIPGNPQLLDNIFFQLSFIRFQFRRECLREYGFASGTIGKIIHVEQHSSKSIAPLFAWIIILEFHIFELLKTGIISKMEYVYRWNLRKALFRFYLEGNPCVEYKLHSRCSAALATRRRVRPNTHQSLRVQRCV